MKTISKQLLVIVAAVFLTLTVLSAATDEKETARHELRSQLSQFAKSNIFPSLKVWKTKLDSMMDPSDLKNLNVLRTRANDLHKQGKQAMKSMHESWKNEDYATLKTSRDQLKLLMQERDILFNELKPIATKNMATLKSIGETAKPKVAEWKEKGRAIIKSWVESHNDKAGNIEGFKGGLLSQFGGGDKKKVIARFMLWNGDVGIIEDMNQEPFQPTPPQNGNGGLIEPNNYPNPFGSNTSINFNLPKSDKVSLKIYDISGNMILTLADEMLQAGDYSYNYTPNTSSGTYFYRLETGDGILQKSMEFLK